jgi:hypothetical protein
MATVEQLSRETHKPVVVLSVLVLVAGAGGMTISFLYLGSLRDSDVVAGGVGFIAGSVLLAAGLLSLAVHSRSPGVGDAASQVIRCLAGLAPPLVAAVSWPVFYFSLFIAGLPLILLVLLACVGWAWMLSGTVAVNLAALFNRRRSWIVRGIVFVLQTLAILASWPLFRCLLDLLESMGHRVGWS